MIEEKALIELYKKEFNDEPKYIFSAPGRSELSGNHTDHQHGVVLAAAIDLCTRAIVNKNADNHIRIKSNGFSLYDVDLDKLEYKEEENQTTTALIKGIAAYFVENQKKISGFNAYVYSDVLVGSGLSSSAAFEVLVATIINELNQSSFSKVELAKIAQYAENEYFKKPCGLMDQLASSLGNVTFVDFKENNPFTQTIDFDFENCGYTLCVVDSGASHDDLTQDYADITNDLKNICNYFNKNYLREIEEQDFYQNIKELRTIASDRAILRAMHVYNENKRVIKQVEALKNNDFETYLKLMNESGDSSWKYLQNVIASNHKDSQELALGIALCKKLLNGKGASRVHGGGFAGTIQAFVPNDELEDFKNKIEEVFGKDSCLILKIRKSGSILEKHLN